MDTYYEKHQECIFGVLRARIWTSNAPIVFEQDGQTIFLTVKKGTDFICHLESTADDLKGPHHQVESNIQTNDGKKMFLLTGEKESTVTFKQKLNISKVLKFTARPCQPHTHTSEPIFIRKGSTLFEIRIEVV